MQTITFRPTAADVLCHQGAELSCVVLAVGSIVPDAYKSMFLNFVQECIVFCCSDEGKVM
jgi:hypothetical protein